MKKTLLLLSALLLTVFTYAWKPIFIGHRGSDRGVENTVEAYTEGVTYYGCDGLECDVQVTKDGKFVLCHDSKLDNYGLPGITISDYTLEQLQGMTMTQTRNGINYSSKICTLEEYLAICQKYHVHPVIELKGAKGLSDGDMSNFSAVYQLIQKYELEDETFIISFMEKAILHVKQNYPKLKCQRLWMNHLITDEDIDWCKENGITPSLDISYKYWDIHTVKRFKKVGLEVATWTINDLGTYNEFVLGRGCYMSSGDCVKKSEAKEGTDIDWDNVADYAETLNPFYVTPLDSFPEQSEATIGDSVTFTIARHTFMVSKSGNKGAFTIKDMSADKKPSVHTEKAFLSSEAENIGFIVNKIDESTFHLYIFADGKGVGGKYISNAAPQYPATNMTIDQHEITIKVGDTIIVKAIVEPERATGGVTWKVDKGRIVSLSREEREVKVIGLKIGEAVLTAELDTFVDTCKIHVVETTDLNMPQKDIITYHKSIENGQVIITKGEEKYLVNGTKLVK